MRDRPRVTYSIVLSCAKSCLQYSYILSLTSGPTVVPTAQPPTQTEANGTPTASPNNGGQTAGNCVINGSNNSCDGDKNQQGGGISLKVDRMFLILCSILVLFVLLVMGDNCDFGPDDNNNSCINDTNIVNPPQSDSTGKEGNRIALGVGIGIGVPAIIVAILGLRYFQRRWC